MAVVLGAGTALAQEAVPPPIAPPLPPPGDAPPPPLPAPPAPLAPPASAPPPAPAPPAPAPPAPASAPLPEPPGPTTRVTQIGNAHWSPALGFVITGPVAASAPEPGAEASSFEAKSPPGGDTGGAAGGVDGAASGAKPPSFAFFYFGAGSISFQPVNSTSRPTSSYSSPPPLYQSASGFEPVFGMRGGGPLGKYVGLWGGLDFGYAFGKLDATEAGTKKTYSVINSPFGVRGGVDFIAAPQVEIGPRLGVAPTLSKVTLESDTSSTAYSSSSGQTSFTAMIEYGAQVRLSLGKFMLAPALLWRETGDITGQYVAADAYVDLSPLYIMGWWDTRVSTSGTNSESDSAKAFGAGAPEESRVGLALGISIVRGH